MSELKEDTTQFNIALSADGDLIDLDALEKWKGELEKSIQDELDRIKKDVNGYFDELRAAKKDRDLFEMTKAILHGWLASGAECDTRGAIAADAVMVAKATLAELGKGEEQPAPEFKVGQKVRIKVSGQVGEIYEIDDMVRVQRSSGHVLGHYAGELEHLSPLPTSDVNAQLLEAAEEAVAICDRPLRGKDAVTQTSSMIVEIHNILSTAIEAARGER